MEDNKEAHLAVPDITDVVEMRRAFKSLSNEMGIDISLREFKTL